MHSSELSQLIIITASDIEYINGDVAIQVYSDLLNKFLRLGEEDFKNKSEYKHYNDYLLLVEQDLQKASNELSLRDPSEITNLFFNIRELLFCMLCALPTACEFSEDEKD